MAKKRIGLRELDVEKHISPETLGMLISGDPAKLREATNRPDVQFLLAQAKERRRQLFDAIKYYDFYRTPPEQRPTAEPAQSAFAPQPPGAPQAPGLPQSPGMPGGLTTSASLRDYIMAKVANGDESQQEHDIEEDKGEETPEEERSEQMDPEILQQLVNMIVEKGDSIDDERDFHSKTDDLGVNTHEAEEEIYKLLASLVGGKNDMVPGGLAAGMPTDMFPSDQVDKGTEVELEHTSNPAIAQEIAKDHLTEGNDYYDPRLEDLEKGMKKDVDAGKVDETSNAKTEKNKERKDEDVEKLKKASADKVPGGRASGMSKSKFSKKQVQMGVKVEKEHTPDKALAAEIARDHLTEAPDYYTRLDKMEKKIEKDKEEGKLRKTAFKHGFFMKLAESGITPSEFEEIFRYSFQKAAADPMGGVAAGLTGGAVLSKLLDIGWGGAKGLYNLVTGAGKLGLVAPLLLAPILGGAAGGSLYYMTRPDELDTEDIKHMERIALYKRLAQRARRRTRKEETEAESEKTRGDDAHRKLLPLPSTPTVEV